MIITLILVAVFLAALILSITLDGSGRHEDFCIACVIASVILGAILIVVSIWIISENTLTEEKAAAANAERDAIIYQLDHGLYLGDAVGNFNSKVVYERRIRENPWTSWFQGKYILEIEPIPVPSGGG